MLLFTALNEADGQAFIQAYSRQILPQQLQVSLSNCSIHVLDGSSKTLSILTSILDSNYVEVAQFESSHFIVQDSVNLLGKICADNEGASAIDWTEHSKVFVRHTIVDELNEYNGEFLFEYAIAKMPDALDNAPDVKNDFPISIHGDVSVTYEYNSANYEYSYFPKHFVTYTINPELTLWGLPFKGNFRFSPGNAGQFKPLSYSNLQFDILKFSELKKQAKNRAENELKKRQADFKKELLEKIEKEKSQIQEDLDRIEERLKDSLTAQIPDNKIPIDTSLNLEVPDSLRKKSDFSLNGQDSLLNQDSVAQYKENLDSLVQQAELLKQHLQELKSLSDSISEISPQHLVENLGNESLKSTRARGEEFRSRLQNVKLNSLAVGKFYPSLPELTFNQSAVEGADVSLQIGTLTHEISAGRIANLLVGNSSIGMLRYSVGQEKTESYKIRATLIHNFNTTNNTRLRNPIIDLEYSKTLLKNGLLEYEGEIAMTHMKVFNPEVGLDQGESNYREQSILLNNNIMPGLSAKSALKGNVKGYSIQVGFTEVSSRFSTVLNPYKINGLRSVDLNISKSFFKNLIQLSGTGIYTREESVSNIQQVKTKLKINPARLPKVIILYHRFNRSYLNGNQQLLNLGQIQSSYSVQLWKMLHRFQLTTNVQENKQSEFIKTRSQLLSISDQLKVAKSWMLGITMSTNRVVIEQSASSMELVQKSAAFQLTCSAIKNTNASLRYSIAKNGSSLNSGGGVSIDGQLKSFRLGVSYDINSSYLGGQYYTTNRTLNRLQTNVTYEF